IDAEAGRRRKGQLGADSGTRRDPRSDRCIAVRGARLLRRTEIRMKRIAILGSTGSIGQSALAVVDAHPDRLQVVGLAAGENSELLGAQIARYRPLVAAMATGGALDRLKQSGASAGLRIEGAGRDGLAAGAST